MVKRLLTVKEVAERYQCSEKTARRYMRRMEHMESPLRVTEQAVEAWELERTRKPAAMLEKTNIKMKVPKEAFYISRIRRGIMA